jgi:hypothetical protein
MGDFVDLLKESTIFQGVITLIVLGTWSFLVVTGKAVPQDIYLLLGTVVGFFFGGKYQQLLSQSHKDNQATIRAMTTGKED